MGAIVQVYRAKINPASVPRLLEIRPQAIAQAQAACAALLGAELVRVDEETWLDILTFSRPEGIDELMAKAADLPLLGEMHGLISEVLAMDSGDLAHTSRP